MPRYFFHIHHTSTQTDHEGKELPDKDTALEEGAATLGRLLQDIPGCLLACDEPWRMEITDEFADPLFEIEFIVRRKT